MRQCWKPALICMSALFLVVPFFNIVTGPEYEPPERKPTSVETFQVRRNRLKEVCRERKGKYRNTIGRKMIWFRNLWVSERLSLVYCLIHKVGSSYWKNLGMRYNALPLSHYSATEREEFLKKFTTVLVVRHPFNRLVSAYNDRMTSMIPDFVEAYGPKVSKFYPQKTRNPCLFDLDFETFAKFVIADVKNSSHFDSHWMPFYRRCRPCEVKYEIISTLETFKEDMAFLDKRIHTNKNIEDKKRFHRATVDACKPFKPSRSDYKEICNDGNRIVDAKMKGLRNKGYLLPNETLAFNSTEKDLWFDLCRRLTSPQLLTSEGREQVRQRKKERTREAFKSLKKSTYNKLKALYKLDFQMFGYDPDDVIK